MKASLKRKNRNLRSFYQVLVLSFSVLIVTLVYSHPVYAKSSTATVTKQGSDSALPEPIRRIRKRGKLLVAMYRKDVKPFYFIDKTGALTGIDVELIKGFTRLLGIGIEFDRSAKTFNGVINKVASREADVAISKLGMTFSRATKVRYTDPYIILHQGLLVNRLELARQGEGRHQIGVIKELRGKLGVIAKSSYVENAKARFKLVTVVGYPSWDKVVDAAVAGKVVAAYRDEVEIKKIIRDQPDTAIKFISVVLKDAKDPKAMVVAWDDSYLQYLLNFYIQYLDLDLTANKVLDHYDEVISKIKEKTTIR